MIRAIVISIALLTFHATSAIGQQEKSRSSPTLPSTGNSVGAFVPKGWEIEARSDGDLNQDGQSDVALVLRRSDPLNITKDRNTNPRMLVIAFANTKQGHELLLKNEVLIPADDNPDIEDPFGGIAIHNGNLRVTFHYWSSAGSWLTGNTTLTFRFREGCFRLIGYDASSMHRATLEESSTSINYLTGKKIISASGESDRKRKTTTKLQLKPLKCINDISDAMGNYD